MIAFINEHRGTCRVEPICKVLPIAPSTYHEHVARRADPSRLPARAQRDTELQVEIRRVFEGIDEDGIYSPADFNDGLVLGIKGTFAQAELHIIRARLHGGKLNEAARGDLRFPLPVGLVFDDDKIVLDPDQEVQGAVRTVFELFAREGTTYGVVRRFGDMGLNFPRRSYGGAWNGKLLWGHRGRSAHC